MSPFELLRALVVGYSWLIILRAVLSWLQPRPGNPLLQALHRITEPVLLPLRRLLPPRVLGGLDLSPIIAIILLQILLAVLTGR